MRLPYDRRILIVGLGVVMIALLLVVHWTRGGRNSAAFQTAPVKWGDLRVTISATGTLEPEEVVDIGAQVAGMIVSFGKDVNGNPVDYGSVVKQGTVLARIDDALYAADVATAKAQLAQNKAAVANAEANLEQLKAKYHQAQRDWARAQKLGPSDALSQADYDSYQSAYETARANVEVGKATIEQAKKTVEQAQASLKRAQQNLDYCTIRSPVKGVIIDRRVNIGQTVVSSLNAPSLFLIAKDLTRIQVWVSVNEADIGRITPGQPVAFTVDAFPGEVFWGTVGRIRLNATMTQNVVTYTVEVNTDNANGKLLPYLTANANFIVGERHNVLSVPNAALRWLPQPDQIVEEFRGRSRKARGPEAPGQGQSAAAGGKEESRGIVWVPQGSQVRPVQVRLGLSNDAATEVESPELKENLPVVVGEMETQAGSAKGAPGGSPFAPHVFRGAAKPQGPGPGPGPGQSR